MLSESDIIARVEAAENKNTDDKGGGLIYKFCADCRIRLENDCKDHNITCSDCGKILYTPNEIVVPLMNGDPSYNSFRCHMCNELPNEPFFTTTHGLNIAGMV